MKRALLAVVILVVCVPVLVAEDNDAYLADLFVYFHTHPELSFLENKTAAMTIAVLELLGTE